ncbi:similar to Saccharomyces cerevisiae YMR117C SPC24 Component of the evolutionarily conserved kinetochore-associated Ndc80 complex (Ndc80p-Nuf2p-Spc24p-Spc25p) [Maudiozyma saulgeensis]|uniref:Kinetochore protein Spc24 n=1 Tax=Maudiozyma saulgeensis TaxID=1789683 RepID=A0A1X7R0Q7_9SACH|nr:similar to Saccharomyces cerevisiae YMR117C SPC24 Component of the evolutionarily conserved kinetochore-associated Ndc80 complex (Ndc80p-Nuf2p-Spc24p-Spc25p) [Kazachstania saulgeensis]
MENLDQEFDLSQSISSVATLRETFNTNNVRSSLNEIMDATTGIEQENEKYLEEEEEILLQLKNKVNKQKETVESLNKELLKLKEDTDTILQQDKLVDLVSELDIIEKKNLQLKNDNDKRINELAIQYNAEADNTKHPIDTINLIDRDENEETKKMLEDPVSRANILKLKLFRSLGVVIDVKAEQVFIEESDKIDVLMLNDGYSNYFKTKYIWERIKMNKDLLGAV